MNRFLNTIRLPAVLLFVPILFLHCPSGEDSSEDLALLGLLGSSGAGTSGAGTSNGSQPAMEDPVPTPVSPIYLYSAGQTNGNFGGRSGGDLRCANNKPAALSSCTNIRAFVSLSTTDEIRDMPANYSVPTNAAIVGPTGTQIASNWNDMLDGSISTTLQSADISVVSWWSFSTSNGAIQNTLGDFNCYAGTHSVSGQGQAGRGDSTAGSWMGLNTGGALCSTTIIHLLCVCY